MSIHSITEITDKATLTTLNDVTSHILKVSKFLANAPIEAKTFFATLTPNDKLYVMQHVEYLEDGIRFIDDSGKEICIMEKNDLEVPEKDLKKGKIEKHG